MKGLILGDPHLKDRLFVESDRLMQEFQPDFFLCLGDMIDDWGQDGPYALDRYRFVLDQAVEFAKKYQDKAFFLIGNHENAYCSGQRITGYNIYARSLVIQKLQELNDILPTDNKLSVIKRIDNVMFMHGGLSNQFIYDLIRKKGQPLSIYDEPDELIRMINELNAEELEPESSPVWFRPKLGGSCYQSDTMLQVVGHHPVERPYAKNNVLYCDTFNTKADGSHIGTCEFVLIDTKTWEWKGIPSKIGF